MEKWNYSTPGKVDKSTQVDWNQTLITMFNFVSKGKESPIDIKIPSKLIPIIDTLSLSEDSNVRYNFEFIEEESNVIDVSGLYIEVINF